MELKTFFDLRVDKVDMAIHTFYKVKRIHWDFRGHNNPIEKMHFNCAQWLYRLGWSY